MEEFKECGIACEENCDNLGQPIICTRECSPGCFCKNGYIREKENGYCIPLELCVTSKSDSKLNLFEIF